MAIVIASRLEYFTLKDLNLETCFSPKNGLGRLVLMPIWVVMVLAKNRVDASKVNILR